ncbi:helix-turn-helix domain-containing protein [Pseudobacillus badius]|uniref:helix-turn-helix domain-containing protein n=1 Tax=Bacillus badius TaxID=1455 RepID=UPI0007B07471|nr:helix-turn-helix domain-containing protein [Bacillus badius]KZN99393.1 transcriptional regulator [Bacillus badius]OCS84980.1 transcriptional regulator [Bacillus badius]OVE49210.1 transcriptional regulator [Bacillus badius]TDW00816.1 DNA-binding XRE family transcriptional regulator [Bacillus badius]
MAINNRIRELRKKSGLTQKELADKVNVSPQVISNWERRYTNPDYDDVKKLAEIFDCSSDYLLGRSDNPKPSNEEFNSLAEINRMVKEYGIESFGFFDIEQWKQLSREDVEEIRKHFEWVAHKAKERNESDFDD